MEAQGEFGPEYQPHRIVPGGSYGGNPDLIAARTVLRDFFHIDDAANRIYLPIGWHQSVHTNDYFAALNTRLSGATSAADVASVLGQLEQELQNDLTFSPRTGTNDGDSRLRGTA